MPDLLEAIEFRDPARARREAVNLSAGLSPALAKQIEALLASSPDPDRALHGTAALRDRRPDVFERLSHSGARLRQLITVFGASRFLSEEVCKHPEWLEEVDQLDHAKSAADFATSLTALLRNQPAGAPEALSLALFRRRQILRILLRDMLGYAELSEIAAEISSLADAILDVSYTRIRARLVERYGRPLWRDADGHAQECGMAVIALGKLGGEELNYSSDIDLMFVYTAQGETEGPNSISNQEFYKKVANQYTELLSTYTPEGLCYRVDLRLRPDGSLGEVCISLDGARKYYQTRARDWELQMLIKARAAAGDRETGHALLESVEPLIYSTTTDFSAVEAVSATRERIGEKLNQRRGGRPGIDIKLARGGIRDIEFLVQCLQRLHGGRVAWVRHGGTLLALSRLADKDLLSAAEFGRLASAYRFLRNLEHRLQFEDDRQTHTLPDSPRELDLLARKMPSAQLGAAPSGEKLLQELSAHLQAVQEIYERVIHAQKPTYYSAAHNHLSAPVVTLEPAGPEAATSNLVRFLDQRAPSLARAVSRAGLRHGARAFEHFLERIVARPELLGLLDGDPAAARFALDLFDRSPHFSEELIRAPELAQELAHIASPESGRAPYAEAGSLLPDPASLRRFFRREMFRIQAASICLRVPVFDTLARTSELADTAIAAAYRLALAQTLASHPPSSASYRPGNQMMVVALGRLGMREFDLASDADLIFVLPDEDQAEQLFWTRVANRLIDSITAYTAAGIMFAVDTRLRPNGADGALVQCESAYKDYFDKSAEAWEGISYMKARAITGDLEPATRFLNELQEIDWRRWGQSGRSRKDLRAMRLRLEKEQGAGNPLKSGQGGFYDIDFSLMYLRLKGGGIFFKVLNMPERIDIIEKMGHLERSDATFLRDAVTFYRAVDHGLRVYSGHAGADLPNSETQLEVLTELVARWTPEHQTHQPLPAQLAHIRDRTREIFDRLFS